MILEKQNALKPLIESSRGIHLTAYIENTGDLNHLKSQIKDVIAKAELELLPALSSVERRLFLLPLRLLLNNNPLLGSFKHNIGIFRTVDSFRVLAVPVEVDSDCVVATSYHVKPLLRWMRVDRGFFLLGLEKHSAHLYQGSQHSLSLVASLKVPDGFTKADSKMRFINGTGRKAINNESIEMLSDWICKYTRMSKSKLFVAGDIRVLNSLRKVIPYAYLVRSPLADSFSREKIRELSTEIRTRMESETLKNLESLLIELRSAEERQAAGRNIFQIAKAVAEGRVRKLLVADGVKIFGKFNSKTGKLKIHPRDLNHEDDDVLDDIAQEVLAKGGDVYVTSKLQMPTGCLAWALLEPKPFQKGKFLNINKQLSEEEVRVAI